VLNIFWTEIFKSQATTKSFTLLVHCFIALLLNFHIICMNIYLICDIMFWMCIIMLLHCVCCYITLYIASMCGVLLYCVAVILYVLYCSFILLARRNGHGWLFKLNNQSINSELEGLFKLSGHICINGVTVKTGGTPAPLAYAYALDSQNIQTL